MNGRNIVILAVLLTLAISMVEPVFALEDVDYFAVCADKPVGWKDFTPHYLWKNYDSMLEFPPGSTVYIYVEDTGRTKEDLKTGHMSPSIGFELTGERLPTGYTFSASSSSDYRINNDLTPTKRTYGILSFSIEGDAVEGKYRIRITTKDNNDGGKAIGRTPYIYFYIRENATMYPPYNYTYKDLKIAPNPAELGETVTVSVNVTNIGGKGSTKGKDVVLYYNNRTLTNNLHLGDDELKILEFKLSKEELKNVGTYNITIGDLNDTLVVKEKPTPPPGGGTTSDDRRRAAPGFEALYAVSGIVIAIYLMSKRRGG